MSRYSTQCPFCGATVHPLDHPFVSSRFPCANCGTILSYATPHAWTVCLLSAAAAILGGYLFGLRGIRFVIASIFSFPFVYSLGIIIAGLISPASLKQSSDLPMDPIQKTKTADTLRCPP
jgi:hypothetical protein